MTECEGGRPIRAECAAALATLEANSNNTNEKVDEIHDLLVKNGFIARVAATATAVHWIKWILGGVVAGMGVLAALHFS